MFIVIAKLFGVALASSVSDNKLSSNFLILSHPRSRRLKRAEKHESFFRLHPLATSMLISRVRFTASVAEKKTPRQTIFLMNYYLSWGKVWKRWLIYGHHPYIVEVMVGDKSKRIAKLLPTRGKIGKNFSLLSPSLVLQTCIDNDFCLLYSKHLLLGFPFTTRLLLLWSNASRSSVVRNCKIFMAKFTIIC